MLQIWDVHWSLDVSQCPCDVHFTQWLGRMEIVGARIFHFGTGGHHHVGLHNMERGTPNTVIGITASPQEFQAFMKLAMERPRLSQSYQVLFGDIYLFNERMFPPFDIVTLFHLFEYRGDSQDAYGGLTDRQVTAKLLELMPAGGRLLLYAGSFAFDQADRLAAELVRDGQLADEGAYESLRIYRRCAPTG